MANQSPVSVEQLDKWELDLAVTQLAQQPIEGLTVCADETMEEAIYQLAVERQPFWKNPFELAAILYAFGVLLLLLRLGSGIFRLIRLHRQSRPTGSGDVRILREGGDAFTFGTTVYLSQSVYDAPDAEVILAHERAHAAQWHTFDALLAEVMRAMLWFHPLAWWLREQVQLNLEYLADATVLAAGYDKRDYQLSLVAHQQGVDFRTSLLPQFAAKGLKRRILMMGFRAGSQVRSWVVTGGLVACALVAFVVTNGKAQPVNLEQPTAENEVSKTSFTTLFDGAPHELNIYFKRLPSPAEVAIMREEMKYFYQRDLYVFKDCTDPMGTLTFAIGKPNGISHQVKFAAGEETTLPQRFQLTKDGNGNAGGAVFRPQPLPDGAPEGDVVYSIDGEWVTIEASSHTPYTAENLNAAPLSIAINCQLGLNSENFADFNVGKNSTVTPIADTTPEQYVNAYIKGWEEGSGTKTIDIKFFLSETEVGLQEFYQHAAAPDQLLTIARRMNSLETIFAVRLDPNNIIGNK